MTWESQDTWIRGYMAGHLWIILDSGVVHIAIHGVL